MEIRYNNYMLWKEYITSKYLLWRQDKLGHSGSAARFAAEIGVTAQLLSDWMNRDKIPNNKSLNKLVAYFGEEVYDVLELPRPDPRATLVAAGLPSEFIDRLFTARDEYSAELERRGITTDSPTARQIITDTLRKYGIQLTDTK